jgi:hypothetical protein
MVTHHAPGTAKQIIDVTITALGGYGYFLDQEVGMRNEKLPFSLRVFLFLGIEYYYYFPLFSNLGQGMLAFTSCAAVHLTL